MSEQAPTTQSTNEVVQPADSTILTTGQAPEVKAEGAPEVKTDAPAKDAAQEKPPVETKVVPEKYEFKAIEGSPLKPADVDKIAALAKERGLSQDEAQKLLEEKSQERSSFLNDQQAEFNTIRSGWREQFQKDPEIGGEHAKATAENAKRAIEKFASPELKQALNVTGFGDHPELIRVFARIGKSMAEDKTVMPGKVGTSEKFEAKDVLYPSHKQTE